MISTGCNEDDRKVTSIEVAIRSDFLVGDELSFVYVESLSANQEDVVQRAWLELDADCADGREGARLLGSISVSRRDGDTAHLRVRGYHRNPRGEAELLAERRVDLRFEDGARATLELLRTCAATPGDCDGGLCLPSTCTNASAVVTSSTGAQGLEDCLSRATVEPVVALLDAGGVVEEDVAAPAPPPAAVCGDEDGACPKDCAPSADIDCRLTLGTGCQSDDDCATAHCEQGVCCETTCRGECLRCDLPASAGVCSDLVADHQPPLDPSYDATCDARRVRVEQGAVSCLSGWAQCATADAYWSAMAESGCDTELGTPTHCASCGDVCPYSFCSPAKTCDARARGILDIDTRLALPAGSALGNYVTPLVGETVRALGVMLDPRFAHREVRLALYGDISNRQEPYELLATTSRILDATSNGLDGELPAQSTGLTRLEGTIDPPVVIERGRAYFIFVWAETDTWLLAQSAALLTCKVDAESSSFPPRHQSSEPCVEDDVGIGVYAVVTPAPP